MQVMLHQCKIPFCLYMYNGFGFQDASFDSTPSLPLLFSEYLLNQKMILLDGTTRESIFILILMCRLFSILF